MGLEKHSSVSLSRALGCSSPIYFRGTFHRQDTQHVYTQITLYTTAKEARRNYRRQESATRPVRRSNRNIQTTFFEPVITPARTPPKRPRSQSIIRTILGDNPVSPRPSSNHRILTGFHCTQLASKVQVVHGPSGCP